MNWKKIALISIAVIIIGIIVWVGYSFLRKTEVFETVTTTLFGEQEPTATTPAKQIIEQLTGNEIFDYWVNTKDNSIYYLLKTGQVVKLANNTQETVNSQTLNKLNSIEPSYDGSKIVAKFNYPNLPTFSIFNTVTKNWQPLSENTIAAAWSPTTDELIYLDSNSLNIYNPTTQKSRDILNMTQKEIVLDWVSESRVLFTMMPSIDNPSSLWSINLKTKLLSKLIDEEAGLVINWSKDGSLGLKLHNERRDPLTSLIDENGNVLTVFSFVTLPSKCTYADSKSAQIYCAIPNNINDGIDFPDDYYKRTAYFNDKFYLIDVIANSAATLSSPNNLIIDAEHLELFKSKILFKNRIDDKLYSLELE